MGCRDSFHWCKDPLLPLHWSWKRCFVSCKSWLALAGVTAFLVGLLLGIPGADAAPIFGQSPRTQFFLGTAVRSFGRFQKLSGGGRDLAVWTAPLVASYALRTDATVTLIVPYVNKRLQTPAGTLRADGLGDLQILGKYRFFRRDAPFSRLQAAILGGLKLPTGSNSEGPGIQKAPALQPGSGSVDGIVGGAAGYTTMHWSFEGALTYKINSTAEDFRFGNVLAYDFYVAYQLYPDWPTPGLSQLNISLELNGRTSGHNEVHGREVPESGGTVLFLSPGLQYIVSGNLLLETGVQVPMVRELRGALEPDYTVLFGFRYLF
ncbi:MAG: transporter [Nitrospinota bacterium]|nr:MAG: transporter [Nitrospinota bacterium]